MHERLYLRSLQLLHHHVCSDVVPRDVLRPVTLVNQILTMDSLLVESRDPKCNTEAAVTWHYLFRVMEGLHHIHDKLHGVGVPILLPILWEGPHSVPWLILPLD